MIKKYYIKGGNNDNNVLEDIKLLNSLNQKINNNNEPTLLDYQEPHANKLIDILNKNNTALDASDPGIGKTYISAYICKKLNLKPIVICPKNVVNNWVKILKLFDVEYLMVVNYELISRGKYIYNKSKIISPYIKIIKKGKKVNYEWKVEKDVIFIFDEVHRCKFIDTMNSKLLYAAKQTENKILMLSATIVEKPTEFALFAYVLGLSENLKILQDWIKKLLSPSKTLYSILYSKENPKASRLTISELGDKFPDTQITADTYTMKDSDEIKKEYEKIAEKVEKYKKEGDKSKFIIAKLQSEFRNIELLKIPTFIELANDYIENNFSVVIFVNYTDTLKMLGKNFKTTSLIYGGQSLSERDKVIKDFQDDKTRIIIANIKAGGVGISLHDINGNYPRVSLISPTQSATNLIQVLGRIHRSGGKTKSLQRIIFAENTPEDDISKMLFRKLSNLSLLNDGDMESYYIDGLQEDKEYLKTQKKDYSEEDLNIIIDKQLQKIKKKNFIKTDKMSNLFPQVIDIVSGIKGLYLLKGKHFFKNIEFLLMGEHHYEEYPCYECNKNCLEILDLITYVMYSLKPNIIDFYNEIEYSYLNKKNKTKLRSEKDISKMRKLYDNYNHLINSKNINTENLRMHLSDIRVKESNENIYLDLFSLINHLYLVILEDDVNLFEENNNKYIDDYFDDNYLKNKQNYEYQYDFLKHFYSMMKDDNNKKIMKDIVNGNCIELENKLKITKQQKEFLKSYENDKNYEEIENIHNNINNQFKSGFKKNSNEINIFLSNYIDVLEDIDYIDDVKKYIYKYFKKTQNLYYSFDILIFFESFSYYMDKYTIFRMLRKFNDKKQNNIIFYGGYAHTLNIKKILLNTDFFKVIVKPTNENDDNDCKKLTYNYD
jgi:superfamily II DNA or RNA helicase